MTTPLDCDLKDDTIIVDNDLRITFHRTIRVPDSDEVSVLPPDLGRFPLEPVSDYVNDLPPSMTTKGGLFFPMYQREAMWIRFRCDRPYMIKIYVGDVNAISGETADEDAATRLRRLNILAGTQSPKEALSKLQDYIIVPKQLWLDGIAKSDGTVRQFVAMPFGSGYSVEAQLTRKELKGGLRFEITPYDDELIQIHLKLLTGKTIHLMCHRNLKVHELKEKIHERERIPLEHQRMVFAGKLVEDDRTLRSYGIQKEDTLHMVLRLRGGGYLEGKEAVEAKAAAEEESRLASEIRNIEMSVAAGGEISQAIKADDYSSQYGNGPGWLPSKTTTINVQILNAATYQAVTKKEPPPTPINVSTYAAHGHPFFELPEEPSGIHGDFSNVQSIAQMDNIMEEHVTPRTIPIEDRYAREHLQNSPPGITDPSGPLREFRTVHDLAEELDGMEL